LLWTKRRKCRQKTDLQGGAMPRSADWKWPADGSNRFSSSSGLRKIKPLSQTRKGLLVGAMPEPAFRQWSANQKPKKIPVPNWVWFLAGETLRLQFDRSRETKSRRGCSSHDQSVRWQAVFAAWTFSGHGPGFSEKCVEKNPRITHAGNTLGTFMRLLLGDIRNLPCRRASPQTR
jgi:hypothetical protein